RQMIARLFPVCIRIFCAYFSQNTLEFVLGWQGYLFSCWIDCIADEASKSARQLNQQEGIRMFSEKAPGLRLFPSPAPAKRLHRQRSAILAELDRRRQMRKRIGRTKWHQRPSHTSASAN